MDYDFFQIFKLRSSREQFLEIIDSFPTPALLPFATNFKTKIAWKVTNRDLSVDPSWLYPVEKKVYTPLLHVLGPSSAWVGLCERNNKQQTNNNKNLEIFKWILELPRNREQYILRHIIFRLPLLRNPHSSLSYLWIPNDQNSFFRIFIFLSKFSNLFSSDCRYQAIKLPFGFHKYLISENLWVIDEDCRRIICTFLGLSWNFLQRNTLLLDSLLLLFEYSRKIFFYAALMSFASYYFAFPSCRGTKLLV